MSPALTTPAHATYPALFPACAGSLVTQEDKLRAKVLKGELSEADCALQIKALRLPGQLYSAPDYAMINKWASDFPSNIMLAARAVTAPLTPATATAERRTAQQLLEADANFMALYNHANHKHAYVMAFNGGRGMDKRGVECIDFVQGELNAMRSAHQTGK